MSTKSTAIANEENKSSLNRSSGMKRKADPDGGGAASKKVKVGPTQNSDVMQKSKSVNVALQEPRSAVAFQETIPDTNVPKKSKGGYVLSKRMKEPGDGFAMSMKRKASPTPKKMISDFDEVVVPQNRYSEFSDADDAFRKAKPSSARKRKILKSSIETPETSPAREQNIADTTRTTRTRKPFLAYQDAGSALYGDMVHFLAWLGVIPAVLHDLYQLEPEDPKRTAATYVCSALIFGQFMTFFAITMKNIWFSRLSMAGGVIVSVMANLADWPFEGECTGTALFHGGVVQAVMANLSLSFEEKIVRLCIFFIVYSYISIQSPYSVYFVDCFPLIGITSLGSIFLLYQCHFGFSINLVTVQCSRLILAMVFVRYAIICATSDNQYESIMSFAKGAFVVAVGIAAAGTIQDEILQKEQLEVVVRKRTQKLHMVNLALQASETAIAITDKWGCIIWVNCAFERISARNEERLLGRILKDVIYSLDTATKENKYILMESYDDPSKRSERELKINQSIFHLEATPFSSESYSKDKPELNDRFLMVFKDITAGRAREIAEKKAQQEAMLAKAMGESMVTLTHELRTPLQGIMGVTSMLLQQASDLTKDTLDSLKLIMASSTLLLNLINNLLDVKKANAKMMEDFPLMSISASEQIKDAVCFCQPLAFISNVNLVTDLRTDKSPIVRSNALRLQQVLINLVSNAIKYTDRGSDILIQIRVTCLGDVRRMIDRAMASSHNDNNAGDDDEMSVLVFSVADSGPGIVPSQAGRLFQQYAQLESGPSRALGSNGVGQPSGTGVGLHLCQLFVKKMNGQVWATNNGRGVDGSTFSFYLPLVSYATCDCVREAALSKIVSHSRSISNFKDGSEKKKKGSVFDYRVLVVDDILINRKVFDRMIKKVGVSYSTTVDSGKSALEELSRDRYDLVITDLQMPGMSGTELSDAIRDRNTSSTAPIVVGLTADISSEAVKRCVESGMADLLYKPITVSEMNDYFEMTVPNLKPGIWYKETTSNSYHNGVGSDGSMLAEEEQRNKNNDESAASSPTPVQ